jgi:transcriptional regulator with XRE-family HTH domain
LRGLRAERDLPLRTVAAAADMDPTLLSKVELGQRVPTEEQMSKLAKFFRLSETEAQGRRIAEKFRHEGEDNPAAAREAVLILAEQAGVYRVKKK